MCEPAIARSAISTATYRLSLPGTGCVVEILEVDDESKYQHMVFTTLKAQYPMSTKHQTHAMQRRSLQTCRVTAHRKPAAYLRDRARRLASRAALRRGLMMRRWRRGWTDASPPPPRALPPAPPHTLR